MAEIAIRMDEEEAARLHQLASKILGRWQGEEGIHVDDMTLFRRRPEAGLRAHGWQPVGDGTWIQRTGRRR